MKLRDFINGLFAELSSLSKGDEYTQYFPEFETLGLCPLLTSIDRKISIRSMIAEWPLYNGNPIFPVEGSSPGYMLDKNKYTSERRLDLLMFLWEHLDKWCPDTELQLIASTFVRPSRHHKQWAWRYWKVGRRVVPEGAIITPRPGRAKLYVDEVSPSRD